MEVNALCYKEWYLNWSTHSLFLYPISHSICVKLLLIVLFVSLLQTLADTHWNWKQCFDGADCCDINIARKCCEAHLCGGEVVFHPKEAKKKKNKGLRNKHICSERRRQTSLLSSNLKILSNLYCVKEHALFYTHNTFFFLQHKRHFTIKWNYNPWSWSGSNHDPMDLRLILDSRNASKLKTQVVVSLTQSL